MIVHEIHDLSNNHAVELLKLGFSAITDERLVKNYHPKHSEENSNIFFILEKGRYGLGKGKYYVVEDQGRFVCSAGWNQYQNENIALALTRMYTAPEYRGNYFVEKYILSKTLKETEDYEKVWMTVNEYNKAIYSWFVRAHQGKTTALFNDWPDTYRLFYPIGKKIIYNTSQYVMELRKES